MPRFEMPDTHQPVVIAARRTPIARAGGALRRVELEDLAAPVLKALISDGGVAPQDVDDVILGNATGGGGNIARLAALRAGFPVDVAGVSVDRQCGSGLEAIMMACNLVAAGAGQVYLAGGVESTSRAPIRMRRPDVEGGEPTPYARARFSTDEIGDPDMGIAAENVARQFNITRARADGFALQSHRRACQSQNARLFDQEICPINTGKGDIFARDEGPRSDTSLEKHAALPPAFLDGGTVTAGNACPLNDGASAVLVTSLAMVRRLKSPDFLAYAGGASAGVDPNILGVGPVASTQKLLARQPELDPNAVQFIEFNEAFAAQVLASLDALGIDETKVNQQGGALALGHPFGASGAILVTRLFHQFRMAKTSAKADALGLAMMGIGGGMGLTAAFRYKPVS